MRHKYETMWKNFFLQMRQDYFTEDQSLQTEEINHLNSLLGCHIFSHFRHLTKSHRLLREALDHERLLISYNVEELLLTNETELFYRRPESSN